MANSDLTLKIRSALLQSISSPCRRAVSGAAAAPCGSRWRWTPDQKREIAAESLNPETTPTEVARKHRISGGLLYTWRQQLLGDQVARHVRTIPSFAQVDMAAAPDAVPAAQPVAQAPAVVPPHPEGRIEIVLPGGVMPRVDAQVDGRALRRVLGAPDGITTRAVRSCTTYQNV